MNDAYWFGDSVAISGDIIVVGAKFKGGVAMSTLQEVLMYLKKI